MASKRKGLDKRTLGIIGIVLGVQIIACAGLVMSVHNRKAAMEQTLAGKETALNNVRTVSAGLPALQAQYEKMQAQVRFLEKGLPEPEYIPTLLGDVEQTAIASGVKIQEFRPKPVTTAPGATPAATNTTGTSGCTQDQFDMTVQGNYGQIQKFLKSLTRFRKILALNSIKIQPMQGGKPSQSPLLTATLSLTAFVLPPSPADAAPALAANASQSPASGTTATPAAAKVAQGQGVVASQTAARG